MLDRELAQSLLDLVVITPRISQTVLAEAVEVKRVLVAVTPNAEITGVTPNVVRTGEASVVTLKISHISLGEVGFSDLKVAIGPIVFAVAAVDETGRNEFAVKFVAPSQPPDPSVKEYRPVLLVAGKVRVGGAPGLVLAYR